MAEEKTQVNPVRLLLEVVDEGNAKSLKKVLQRPDLNLDGANKHGERALHIAAGYGKLEFVKMLHKAGAQLDVIDKQGDTPLYWAARHGHSEVVQYLCSNGVDINHQDKSGETAILVASRYMQPEVLKVLCQFRANLDLQDKEGESPLLCACWHGFQSVVEQLVQSGCSLAVHNHNGETPVHVAAVRGSTYIVRYLCEHGAETNPVSLDGHTPLFLATRRNHLDIVQYLCELCGDLNIQDMNGDTALHEACGAGQLSLVYTLCAAGASLDLTNDSGLTPLHVAAINGHIEVVRYLCSSGCKLNIADTKGETPDISAANAGHHKLSDMIRALIQDGTRDCCLDELTLGTTKLNRVRLLVCGASGVGKSTLISSLRTKFLRTLRRHTFGGSYLGSAALDHTYGFCVQQITIPGAGEFSAWDFSGRKEYYPAHEFFLDCNNGIYLIVYNSTDPFDTQLAQVRFWLSMIKSKHRPNAFIHFAGHYGQKPYVVLVSSFSDVSLPQPPSNQMTNSLSDGSGFEDMDDFTATSPLSHHVQHLSKSSSSKLRPFGGYGSSLVGDKEKKGVLQCVVEEFGDHFMFTDNVFHLDCRQPRGRETRRLRTVLGTLRDSVLKQLPWVPKLVSTLQEALPDFRQEHFEFPVVTWKEFLSYVKERINPLVSEEQLQIVADALTDIGEIIHIKEGHLNSIVILEVDWLGQRVFGPALSPENVPIMKLRSMTGRVPIGEVQRVYPELHPLSVLHLLEHFELCRSVGNDVAFEFPALIKMEPLYGIWEKDPNLTVYAGVQIQCTSVSNIFSPSLFPRTQLQIRKAFSEDIEDQELILWTNGLKCTRGEVEICVRQLIPNWSIEIVVRGTEESRTDCYALLHQFYSILLTTIHISNPGTVFTTKVLSVESLLRHAKDPHMYTSMEIFEAERSARSCLTPPSDEEDPETICDLLCCGWKGGEITAKSAPYASIKDIPLQTRVQLCRMLDPPDPFGRDWCLLALQLGLQEEVPAIDNSSDMRSPTDKLLTAWEHASNETIVSLVDALRGIGRDDVAIEVVNGLSPFNNPNSSLILNVGGVVATSYIV